MLPFLCIRPVTRMQIASCYFQRWENWASFTIVSPQEYFTSWKFPLIVSLLDIIVNSSTVTWKIIVSMLWVFVVFPPSNKRFTLLHPKSFKVFFFFFLFFHEQSFSVFLSVPLCHLSWKWQPFFRHLLCSGSNIPLSVIISHFSDISIRYYWFHCMDENM